MRRTTNGLPILYEKSHIFQDGLLPGYFRIRLLWNKGLKWNISGKNLSCTDRRLMELIPYTLEAVYKAGQRDGREDVQNADK